MFPVGKEREAGGVQSNSTVYHRHTPHITTTPSAPTQPLLTYLAPPHPHIQPTHRCFPRPIILHHHPHTSNPRIAPPPALTYLTPSPLPHIHSTQHAGLNVYDIRIPCEIPGLCYDFSMVETFLARPEVLEVGLRVRAVCSLCLCVGGGVKGDWV